MAATSKLRIVMFPWLAFGHIIPYLELAKLIALNGHSVFFISTALNLHRLPKLPPDLIPLIQFINLPLPPVDNLPEQAQSTADVPSDLLKYLHVAYDELRQPMAEFLQSSAPDWILHDFASPWLTPIARRVGAKIGFFSIFIPEFLASMGPTSGREVDPSRVSPADLAAPPPWVPFPTTVSFTYYEIKKVMDQIAKEGSESIASGTNRIFGVIESCDIVAIRACDELSSEWLQLLRNIYHKPVLPVGQIPTTEYFSDEDTETWRTITTWLDNQNPGSVIYVAFGSEAKPSQSELTEIAAGLELSELPFFWVLKTRRGEADPDVLKLPEGFEDRTRGRGMVCTSWAPQRKILAHDSVGGFLTHSGWSSVVEAIEFEKALILLAMFGDQGINTKVLTEKKLGYPIPRDEFDGSFTRNSVADSVKLVMVEDEGKIYRDRVKEMRGLFLERDKQMKYVENFLEFLAENRESKKIMDDEALES